MKQFFEVRVSSRRMALKIFVALVVGIFTVELVIMTWLLPTDSISPLASNLLDSTLLVVILFPYLYLLVLRPMMSRSTGALMRSEARLREAQRIAQLGNWDWDLVRNKIFWSEELYRIFGLEAGGSSPTYQLFLTPIHPDDVELVRQHLHGALQEGKSYQIEYRIRLPEGEERFVYEQVEATVGPEGRPTRLIGTVHDVTHARRSENAARDSEARLRAVIDNAVDGIITIDAESKIESMNHAAELMFQHFEEDVLGEHVSILVPGLRIDLSGVAQNILASTGDADSTGRRGIEFAAVRKDGTYFPAEIAVADMQLHGDCHYMGIITDITERKEAEREIERMAHYDALTGLPNRTLFIDRLSQAVALAERSGQPFAVMFLDLDGFKGINDTEGHKTGDLVLKEVAKRFRACVREADTVARIGGDEFTMILPRVGSTSDAEIVADAVIRALNRPFVMNGNEYKLGCSIGISMSPLDATDGETLLMHADAAMYSAKEGGKNGFRMYAQLSAA